MKSEQRHQLKTNELEKLRGKLQPFFEKYGLQVALAVSAAVILVAGVMILTRSSDAAKSAGWSELYSANSAEKYLEVAEKEDLAGKPVADWARLQAAESYLQTGIQQSLQNREPGGEVSDLNEARKHFDLVLASDAASTKSNLRERALYGLACCLEAMAGVKQPKPKKDKDNKSPVVTDSTTAGLLGEAIKAYKIFVEEFPDSPHNLKRYEDEKLGRLDRRIVFLQSEDAQEFYAWFRTQTPKPSDRPGPMDNFPFGGTGTDDAPVMLPPIPGSLRLPDESTDTEPDDDNSGPALKPPSEEKSGDTPAAPNKK